VARTETANVPNYKKNLILSAQAVPGWSPITGIPKHLNHIKRLLSRILTRIAQKDGHCQKHYNSVISYLKKGWTWTWVRMCWWVTTPITCSFVGPQNGRWWVWCEWWWQRKKKCHQLKKSHNMNFQKKAY